MHLEYVNVLLKRNRSSFPGIKRPELEFNHSPLSRTKFETGWRYSSTPLLRLHAMYWTFLPLSVL